MSWAVGFDTHWNRWVGYGVPAWCDHPGCYEEIDRGLANVCCGEQMYGGEDGCDLYFCEKHHGWEDGKCDRCRKDLPPFKPSLDTDEWIEHMMTDPSWAEWRADHGIHG